MEAGAILEGLRNGWPGIVGSALINFKALPQAIATGHGKTIIASAVVYEIQCNGEAEPQTLAYFYCNFLMFLKGTTWLLSTKIICLMRKLQKSLAMALDSRVRNGSKIVKMSKIQLNHFRVLYASERLQNASHLASFSPRLVMVYQRISRDRKERALYLLLEEGWDIDRIAVALGVSSRSIERWEANYDEHGHINPPTPIMGRPRLLDQVMTDEIHELLAETPSLLLDEIGEWLAIYHDQPISMSALHENLRDLGLTYKRLKRVAAERDDGFRADWLHNMTTNYTTEQLVFLDESSKDDRTTLPRYGWSLSGQFPFDSVRLNRGIRYSVLPALTIDGYMTV
jgi:transposase